MNILITGSKGFIGRNLICQLQNIKHHKDSRYKGIQISNIFEYDKEDNDLTLGKYCKEANFVFHLAGINRPDDDSEYMIGNYGFSFKLIELLKKNNNKCPIAISSSIQAVLPNSYGESKLASENLFFNYALEAGVIVYVFRLPNVFGKWSRPNYNSVIATFCNNIANNLPITISDPNYIVELAYIDDVIEQMVSSLSNKITKIDEYCSIPLTYKKKLGDIAALLYEFNSHLCNLTISNLPNNSFEKKLYATFLSFLPQKKVISSTKMNIDERGSFTELFKTINNGQFSINISKPGITKGQHWHNTKCEIFVVVSGKALIQQRKIGTNVIQNFEVSGENIQAVHILPGHTHSITNLSDSEELVTLIWSNEIFNPNNSDTFYETV